MKPEELAKLVESKIQNLRPRLLDLSRRNPLIATKLSPRSSSHIRLVDELPDIVFYKLNNGQRMQLISLPAVEDDPRDEDSTIFKDALINAQITDEQYLKEMEAVDRDAEDFLDQSRRIERSLKDRVRRIIGMPERASSVEINLNHHAKINGITPSYELPTPEANEKGDRYNDNNLQTLLLPSDLERKLNAISSRCNTWMQETGINVLHVAFGFLEWSDGIQSESSFAPLILSEAEIAKVRSVIGLEFYISAIGDGPELNEVLAEKLRLDFGVELPPFDGSSVEKYLSEVAELAPRNMIWRVRRQIAIGVFPSARMAMYHDLDPKQENFAPNEIVNNLLVGSAMQEASPFAEEYEIDQPDIESRVPYLVMDADSSQFSTLVDLTHGKNLAVEGPPGTGKSQTIVNAVAAALADGKKVLFVAEKLAALNVVKSRLESIGLGEFLLPLQAERSTREQVVSSIRERIEMRKEAEVRDLGIKLEEFKHARDELAKYLDLMQREFRATGLTIREILGKDIASSSRLVNIPPLVQKSLKVPASVLTKRGLKEVRELGERIEEAGKIAAQAKDCWKATKLLNPDRFAVEEACNIANQTSVETKRLVALRSKFTDVGLSADTATSELSKLLPRLEQVRDLLGRYSKKILLNLLIDGNAKLVKQFSLACESFQEERNELSRIIATSLSQEALELIDKVIAAVREFKLESVNIDDVKASLEKKEAFLATSANIKSTLKYLVERRPESRSWSFSDIASAYSIAQRVGDALIRRNQRAAEADGVHYLRKLCRDGKELQFRRTRIEADVFVKNGLELEEAIDCLSKLREAGFFRVLSKSYRIAKRKFLSISRHKKFNRSSAIRSLEELVSLKRDKLEFERFSDSLTEHDPYFEGIETDFSQYERLVQFYQDVDSRFGHPQTDALRSFLRDAPQNEIGLLPRFPDTNSQLNYETLQIGIDTAASEITNLQNAVSALSQCVHVFADISVVNPENLGSLRQRLESLLANEVSLNDRDDIRGIILDFYEGAESKLQKFNEAAQWASSDKTSNSYLSAVIVADKSAEAQDAILEVLASQNRADELLSTLASAVNVETLSFIEGRPLAETATRLAEAGEDADGLFAHALLATALEEVRPLGLLPLLDSQQSSNQSLEGLGKLFEASLVRQMARTMHSELGSKLVKFSGRRLDELRKNVAQLDREIIRTSRKHLRVKIRAAAKPPHGLGIGRKSDWTELSLLQNEISKKRKFISVRDLTRRAGRALIELKPCWMMSPLAVAQYIPKDSIRFDLCIIDEASQMSPEEGVGALLRCDQTMIVGDTNQLPPTSFFKTLVEDEDDGDDEPVLAESVLEMANAAFRPARRLRWHYRSRHSGLISFSNRLVYDDDLVVFPSATESIASMGVEFRSVAGFYKSGTNPIEAKAIVEAALDFMRTNPNRSLGIVTLNQKQKELIREELEFALKSNRHAVDYIDSWREQKDGLEEFFVKNLENVQGDERDVIFIGTVYGREDADGKVMQRFGPINGLAGKRRLNVLFTRAREKIVTFSSMTADDIVAEQGGNQGAYMLRRWLEYSASGLLEGGLKTDREADSDFELFVMDQIRAMGCEPKPQVGVAGYFIDIGVRHPQWPYGFILGVECDGANYHSAKSARDRDRLRQEVLERLGWRFHRIWSTDWFNDPRREAERLREVIASRLEELKQREAEFSAPRSHQKADQAKSLVAVPSSAKEESKSAGFSKRVEQKPRDSGYKNKDAIVVGDTVRLQYVDGNRATLQVTISRTKSETEKGIIHQDTPVASALLGAEKGEEVEVLLGGYVKRALILDVIKGRAS